MFRYAFRRLGGAGLPFGRDAVCGFAQEAASDLLLGRPAPPTPPSFGGVVGSAAYQYLRATRQLRGAPFLPIGPVTPGPTR